MVGPRPENVIRLLQELTRAFRFQKVLAFHLGVSNPSISKYAKGKRMPGSRTLEAMVQLAGMNLCDLELGEAAFEVALADSAIDAPELSPFKEIPGLDVPTAISEARSRGLRGAYRYIYSMREGVFGIGELEFGGRVGVGILVRVLNLDPAVSEKDPAYDYRGLGFVLGDYLYVVLGEDKSRNELLFLTIMLPTGGSQDALFGHMLVRGLRGKDNHSAVSPLVLKRRERLNGEQAALLGEIAPDEVTRSNLLKQRELDHLLDSPTESLRRHFKIGSGDRQ